MTNTILTDDLTKVYCDAWHESFQKENPFHTVELNAETKSHIVVGLNAVLAELVQRAGVEPNIRECIAGHTSVGYPPEAIAQLQARIEALSAEVERTNSELTAALENWGHMQEAYASARAKLEAQGEAVGSDAERQERANSHAWALYSNLKLLDGEYSAFKRAASGLWASAFSHGFQHAATHPAPAAPVEFIGLTVRERAEATSKFGHVRSDHMLGIAEAIEEKLRSKNTTLHPTQPKGEQA